MSTAAPSAFSAAPAAGSDLERARWMIVLATIVLGLALAVAGWSLRLGWVGAAASAAVLNGILLWHIVTRRDQLFARLLLFGVVAGFAELPADWFSVSHGLLLYPPHEPFLWTSPAYMPFGYSVVLVQWGFLARWFTARFGLGPAMALTGLLGGLNVPGYEFLARRSGYWEYHNVGMFFGAVPYYIAAGEVLWNAALPMLARRIERASPGTIVLLGLLQGAIMYMSWWLSFLLLP